jgi:hypothetical protein
VFFSLHRVEYPDEIPITVKPVRGIPELVRDNSSIKPYSSFCSNLHDCVAEHQHCTIAQTVRSCAHQQQLDRAYGQLNQLPFGNDE